MTTEFKPNDRKQRTSHGGKVGWITTVVTVVVLSLWSSMACADVLLFTSRSGEQSFTSNGFFDFNGAASGGTAFTFTTNRANQRVIIMFDATCLIHDRPGGAVINILVDPAGPVRGVTAPPTDGIANGGALIRSVDKLDNSAARTTVVASVRPALAGTHGVQVLVKPRGDLFGGLRATVTLQAASLTVIR